MSSCRRSHGQPPRARTLRGVSEARTARGLPPPAQGFDACMACTTASPWMNAPVRASWTACAWGQRPESVCRLGEGALREHHGGLRARAGARGCVPSTPLNTPCSTPLGDDDHIRLCIVIVPPITCGGHAEEALLRRTTMAWAAAAERQLQSAPTPHPCLRIHLVLWAARVTKIPGDNTACVCVCGGLK